MIFISKVVSRSSPLPAGVCGAILTMDISRVDFITQTYNVEIEIPEQATEASGSINSRSTPTAVVL